MLGIQDTPGAAIRRSDVALLSQIKYSAAVVADVLAEAGMLDEDREPAVVRWFRAAIADLPAPMRHELGVWFDIMRNGRPSRRGPSLALTPRRQTAAVCAARAAPVGGLSPVAAGDLPRRRASRPAAVGLSSVLHAAGPAVYLPLPERPQARVRLPVLPFQLTTSRPAVACRGLPVGSARRSLLRRPCPRRALRVAGLPRRAYLPAVLASPDLSARLSSSLCGQVILLALPVRQRQPFTCTSAADLSVLFLSLPVLALPQRHLRPSRHPAVYPLSALHSVQLIRLYRSSTKPIPPSSPSRAVRPVRPVFRLLLPLYLFSLSLFFLSSLLSLFSLVMGSEIATSS